MKVLKRVKTMVPGLDALLDGGLFESGVYFGQGSPGSGKTTLANQICFAHIGQGGNALYLTLLAESHTRMLQHMVGQSFFDATLVPSRISYISGYRDLSSGGLKSVVALARAELARQAASMLVLDGLVLPGGVRDDLGLKEFVHELQSLSTLMGCNVLLLTSGSERRIAAEQTMVDGIFVLEDRAFGVRSERLLQVTKFRGSRVARGAHSFCISDEGIVIYPRLESLDLPAPVAASRKDIASTGIAALDGLFPGGPRAATVTVLRGKSGVGKTLLGLSFLAPSSASEPGLLLGCHEAGEVLVEAAADIGINLAPQLGAGSLQIEWVPAGDQPLDQLGRNLLDAVDRRGVRRVVIDSLAGFADKAMFAERGYRFLGALLDELRRRSVSDTSPPGSTHWPTR